MKFLLKKLSFTDSGVTNTINAVIKANSHLGTGFLDNAVMAQKLAIATKGYSLEAIKSAIAQSTLNAEQIKAILVQKGIQGETLKTTTTELAQITATNALSTSQATATASTIGFSSAIKGLEASIKGLASSHPILLAITVVAGVIYGTVKAYDALTISVEEANEAMDEAVSNYETTKSELESINAELTEHQKALDELLAKEKLTYAEQGQLEVLQAITKELQLQQDIASKKADKESKEVAEKAVDAYETQYGNIDATKSGVIDKFGLMNETGGHILTASKDDIPAQIANYVTFNKEAEKLRNKLAESKDLTEKEYNSLVYSAEKYEEIATKSEGSLTDSLQDLVDKRANLQEEYNKAIESQKNGELLTTSQKDIISTYEEIGNAIKLIYEYTVVAILLF